MELVTAIIGFFTKTLPGLASAGYKHFTQKTALPYDQVPIGRLEREGLRAEIVADIVLVEHTIPSPEEFTNRIRVRPPSCAKCSVTLADWNASWMADGAQIGYKCEDCQTQIEGTSSDLLRQAQGIVRGDFFGHWQRYSGEIDGLTKKKRKRYKLPHE